MIKNLLIKGKKMIGKNKAFNLLLPVYILIAIGLFLYSYTQVDLNLTLSRVSVWQNIQKSFQYVGFYQRPLSTYLYLGILAVFFGQYYLVLRWAKLGAITLRQLWILVLAVTAVLVFSYPAFSYDFFNYMFTAKTVLVYHKNPYNVIPLQFSGVEPWLTFMRWTHLPSAYTPLWIIMTLPAYLFGFGFFLLIMWNIKLLVAGFYLLTVWGIGKILGFLDPRRRVLGMAIFALNPLIVVESLVSSHNDIVMMALVTLSFIFYLQKKRALSFIFLSLSVAAKLMTIFLVPVYFLGWKRVWALVAITSGFILVLFQREVLPWYWVWIMPFVALLPQSSELILLSGAVSLGLLLRYAPFLYFGDYNGLVPALNNWGTLIPIFVSLIYIMLRRFFSRFALKSSHGI